MPVDNCALRRRGRGGAIGSPRGTCTTPRGSSYNQAVSQAFPRTRKEGARTRQDNHGATRPQSADPQRPARSSYRRGHVSSSHPASKPSDRPPLHGRGARTEPWPTRRHSPNAPATRSSRTRSAQLRTEPRRRTSHHLGGSGPTCGCSTRRRATPAAQRFLGRAAGEPHKAARPKRYRNLASGASLWTGTPAARDRTRKVPAPRPRRNAVPTTKSKSTAAGAAVDVWRQPPAAQRHPS
mmetsp:Transcript_98997/g.279684  ORF Transcript_98997/g.279684 Transcript_98997/m.279684 type:complete len:238 (+) Transcript_98997:733-1446(+)